jgi:hypothetical protein
MNPRIENFPNPRVALATACNSAVFDPVAGAWLIAADGGSTSADVLQGAGGQLSDFVVSPEGSVTIAPSATALAVALVASGRRYFACTDGSDVQIYASAGGASWAQLGTYAAVATQASMIGAGSVLVVGAQSLKYTADNATTFPTISSNAGPWLLAAAGANVLAVRPSTAEAHWGQGGLVWASTTLPTVAGDNIPCIAGTPAGMIYAVLRSSANVSRLVYTADGAWSAAPVPALSSANQIASMCAGPGGLYACTSGGRIIFTDGVSPWQPLAVSPGGAVAMFGGIDSVCLVDGAGVRVSESRGCGARGVVL